MYCCLAWPAQAEEAEEGAGSSYDPQDGPGTPLLTKKAGMREAGFIFVGRKSWWAGLVLVVVSGLVLGITLVTVLLG